MEQSWLEGEIEEMRPLEEKEVVGVKPGGPSDA